MSTTLNELQIFDRNLDELRVQFKKLTRINKKLSRAYEEALSTRRSSDDELPFIHKGESYSTSNEFLKIKKCTRVILNARGFKYDVLVSNLGKAAPNSRLFKLKMYIDKYINFTQIDDNQTVSLSEICDEYNPENFEFYFDRDPYVLNLILNGLATNKLHVIDNNVCVNFLTQELNYWNVNRVNIESCCLVEIDNKQDSIDSELKIEQAILDEINENTDFGTYFFPKTRAKIWFALENPISSIWATIHLVVYCLFIFLSTMEIILRSIPDLSDPFSVRALNVIEIICIVWFTMQLIIRFILCPSKLKFFISLMNIIDFLSIVPFYVFLIFPNVDAIVRINRVSRILRILTVFKIIGHTRAKTLSDTFKYSYREIIVYLIYLGVSVLVFSTIVFYIESSKPDSLFVSIPATFW